MSAVVDDDFDDVLPERGTVSDEIIVGFLSTNFGEGEWKLSRNRGQSVGGFFCGTFPENYANQLFTALKEKLGADAGILLNGNKVCIPKETVKDFMDSNRKKNSLRGLAAVICGNDIALQKEAFGAPLTARRVM